MTTSIYDKQNDPEKPDLNHPELKKFFRWVGKGKGIGGMSRAKRSLLAKQNSKKAWKTRRKRYGWQGYDPRKVKPRSMRQVRERLIIQCPDLADHPVWKES